MSPLAGRAPVDPACGDATAVVVVYRTSRLDLDWIPPHVPVVVVHNDDGLDPTTVTRAGVVHLHSGANVGFGAAVNAAITAVSTPRVVLVNPDIVAARAHWEALMSSDPDEVRTVALRDASGAPTSTVNRYPARRAVVASGLRLGRWAPRGGALRRLVAPLLGTYGRTHTDLLEAGDRRLSLRDHWVSGALLSLDAARLRAIGGFDSAYFLYWEDVDLCLRLGRAFPSTVAVVARCEPAVHAVGASSAGPGAMRVETIRLASARRYCRRRGYSLCARFLGVRAAALGWRARRRAEA